MDVAPKEVVEKRRLVVDFLLWVFCGATFWLAAHTATSFIPVREIWLPGELSIIAGLVSGAVGCSAVKTPSKLAAKLAYDNVCQVLVVLGLFAGGAMGWFYARNALHHFPPSTGMRILNAAICAILGYSANWGTVWLMERLRCKRPLLFVILVLSNVLQFVITIGVSAWIAR